MIINVTVATSIAFILLLCFICKMLWTEVEQLKKALDFQTDSLKDRISMVRKENDSLLRRIKDVRLELKALANHLDVEIVEKPAQPSVHIVTSKSKGPY